MAGVDVNEGGGKRNVNREINMIPFIDLLLVTVAFLLITAVWVTHSQMHADAQVPGAGQGPTPPETAKALHVHAKEKEFVLVWKQGAVTVSETRLPRHETPEGQRPHYDDLAEQINEEWLRHGGHQDASDAALDRCVLHTDDMLPFREMVAVMDAVYTAKRGMRRPNGKIEKVAAFRVAFASR